MSCLSPFRRFAIRSRNGLQRAIYRQRIRLGLVPQREELSDNQFKQLESVCIYLGPYRNLTTLTAALLSLHPTCQVLNHSGFRILEEPQLNFFADHSSKCFRRFLQYVVTESQGGTGGDNGGSITLSHAFRSETMRETYRARYGEQLNKTDAQCYVWKESLTVTNYLRSNNIDFHELFEHNPHVRFFLPIRHPIDCAISNAKTGHAKRFDQVDNQDHVSILKAVVREIAWFRGLQRQYPDRFFAMFQYDLNAERLREFAGFLNVEPDERWVADAVKCSDIKASYEYSDELVNTFRAAIDEHFSDDLVFGNQLMRFVT